MGKFTLPESAFPQLSLSHKQQKAIANEAQKVLDDTLMANDAFRASGKQFPAQKWQKVRSKEGLSIYKQRLNSAAKKARAIPTYSGPTHSHSIEPSRNNHNNPMFAEMLAIEGSTTGSTSYASSVIDSPINQSFVESCKRPEIPLMVLTGSVDGTLEDVMYGIFADNDITWRWRSSHINDRFDDARILANIHGPTVEDPNRCLVIKWFAKEHPAALEYFIKRRDFLILEATGTTSDANGDPVGYFIMHSVAVPGIPELTDLDIIRGNLSFCFLIRPLEETTIEIYCRGYTDPSGEMMERVSVAICADALICAVTVVDYAYIKKLTWLMKRKQRQSQHHEPQRNASNECESCHKSLSKFGIISTPGSPCQICRQIVCGRCTVVKKMTIDVTIDGAIQRNLKFCLGCVLEAKEYPAFEIASSLLPKRSAAPSLADTSSHRGSARYRSASSFTPVNRAMRFRHKTRSEAGLVDTKVADLRYSQS